MPALLGFADIGSGVLREGWQRESNEGYCDWSLLLSISESQLPGVYQIGVV